MVKPGGTGSSSTDVISARLAPLPPRRSLSSMGGRACVWSKSKTNGIGPPCPFRAPRSERGSLEVVALPTWEKRSQPTFPPALLRIGSGPGAAARSVVRRPGVLLEGAADLALEDLLRLAHEVAHDGQLVGLEALGHLAHLLGDRLLQALQALLGRRDHLDPHAAAVLGVAPAGHHARLLQAVEDEGHGAGGHTALLGQAPGGQRAEAPDQLQATHVGPAQLELLGQILVELAGGTEVPHDLGAQLLGQLRTRPLS